MTSILQSLPNYLKENETLRMQQALLADFAPEEENMKRGDPGKSDYIAHVIAHIIIKIDELEGPKLMNATKADIDKHRNTIFG